MIVRAHPFRSWWKAIVELVALGGLLLILLTVGCIIMCVGEIIKFLDKKRGKGNDD